MRKVLSSGIDRRYVLFPLLVGIALVASLYFIQDARRTVTLRLTHELRDRDERIRKLGELSYTSLESESAQRGFLLTGLVSYLKPYDQGRARAIKLLDELMVAYRLQEPAEVPTLERVQKLLDVKQQEMDRAVTKMQGGDSSAALLLVRSDAGLLTMERIRKDLEDMRQREQQRNKNGIDVWDSRVQLSGLISILSTGITMLLLLLVALLATSEIRRRHAAAQELEQEVNQRTAELKELSEHMLRISEVEKASLARELHDELGGLLVAMRMDFSQLRRKLQMPDQASEERWTRIDSGLKAGVELKRRVIEELRPTLLDNMGLVVALRWQAEQSAQQGNIKLTTSLPEEEPTLNNEAAIAVFRTVQEALANVLKHARASEVRLVMSLDGDQATITVEDNGVGLPDDAAVRAGSHGLKQMKFRMQAIRGSCEVANGPVRGAITTIRFNLAGNSNQHVGAW